MTLAPGTTLGPYQIVSQLGSGGMGVVYQATDPRLKRTVAIKLLPPDLTRDETAKQRFLQEAQAASALDHPDICTIFEITETDDGQLYLVMAHYEGETLKERIARGSLELEEHAMTKPGRPGKGSVYKGADPGGPKGTRGLRHVETTRVRTVERPDTGERAPPRTRRAVGPTSGSRWCSKAS